MPVTATDLQVIVPKRISERHYLAKDLVATTSALDLGGKVINLKPDTSGLFAAANTFELSSRAAAKLGRQQNSVEIAVAPVRDAKAATAVAKFLDDRGVPAGEGSALFAVDLRRRVPGRLVGRDASRLPTRIRHDLGGLLAFEHQVAAQQVGVLQLVRRKKKLWFDLIVPTGVFSSSWSAIGTTSDDDTDDQDIPDTATYPTDRSQDFAACYSRCIEGVPWWLTAVAVAACGGCTTILATVPEPGAVAFACGGCVAAIGIILGNCVLTCHEML